MSGGAAGGRVTRGWCTWPRRPRGRRGSGHGRAWRTGRRGGGGGGGPRAGGWVAGAGGEPAHPPVDHVGAGGSGGAGGRPPGRRVVLGDRQWRGAVRTAAQRARAPGGVPLLSARGNPVLGATIRAVGHRPRAVLELGYGALRSHMLVVGTTGAGKTTALVRLWAGFWAAATRRYRRGAGGRAPALRVPPPPHLSNHPPRPPAPRA